MRYKYEFYELQIRRLHAEGLSGRQIADRIGVQPTTALRMLRALGLKPTGKPGRPRVETPVWVPDYMIKLYRKAVATEGEEGAASLVRRVKRELETARETV
jgi:hypothetical protein